MSLIFGRLTQDFVNFQIVRLNADNGDPASIAALPGVADGFRKATALDASYLVYIGISHALIDLLMGSCLMIFAGVGMFVMNIIFMGIWAHTSEVAAKRLRESYLAAVLRQDIAYFDRIGAGEIATRIETDTREHLHPFTFPPVILTPYFRSRTARYFREGPSGV